MPMPYPGIYQFTAAAEAPRLRGVIRSRFLDTIEDDAIDAMLDAMAVAPSPMAMIQLRVLGGAMARVPADATAFAHRAAPVMVAILDHYEDPSTEAEQVAWTEGLHEQLAARSVGVYSNFLAVEGDERIHEAYPGGRLRAAGGHQAPLRPVEPVLAQPEHPPGRLTELTGTVPGRRTPRWPRGRRGVLIRGVRSVPDE